MKFKLFLFLSLFANMVYAETVYIGDSIAHGYRMYNKANGDTLVGANPKTVLKKLKNYNLKNVNRIVLSSGISNDCLDFKTVEKQVSYVGKKNKELVLINTSKCYYLNNRLRDLCYTIDKCSLYSFDVGRDGIHPRNYAKDLSLY